MTEWFDYPPWPNLGQVSDTTTCTCEEFKEALKDGSGDDAYYPAISVDEGKYEIGCVPIKFCPWCGKRVPE